MAQIMVPLQQARKYSLLARVLFPADLLHAKRLQLRKRNVNCRRSVKVHHLRSE